ncbi:MAG: tRNA uridine-5-carboxymethylaminomethyl(34) synthesis GTPase MnmE [Thermomicrobiales bacterium]|nr:MAG: tRNA uridine-5-carboxymethylaminomethyl(34) synthesis GTPase MnmE [Thermomicrobiales bacterium]
MLDSATIAAISTPPGLGALGVIRISGPDAAEIAARVFRSARGMPLHLTPSRSHRVFYGHIVDPATDALIDDVLLTWLAHPHSYTTEDTVEISCHGGRLPLQETLRVIVAAGARHAEPGEFTLRAFVNGRLDLTQAEAVLDVISARTAEGLQRALGDLRGDLTRRLIPARDAIVSLLAYLDAAADFPDDEIPATYIGADLAAAIEALSAVIAGSRAGQLIRDGAQIALVGRPNVGKSSLLNLLLRHDRAIVTPIAGTTRDVVAESAVIDGIPVTLLDTAGIAETADLVEQLGIERSRRALAASAAALLVLDGSRDPSEADLEIARTLSAQVAASGGGVALVINKTDLPERASQAAVQALLPEAPVIHLSCATGDGLPELENAVGALLRTDLSEHAQPALLNARQQWAIERALDHLQLAWGTRAAGLPIDLMASDVRAALHAIGEVTGEAVDEAVLTEIFSRFCIGK